jgi:hypothetical protein
MIIVRIIGGLGNQMFQYALYRSLKEKGREVKMDLSGFANYGLHNGYELSSIFEVKESIASEHEIKMLSDSSEDFFNKAKRKLMGRKKSHFIQQEFRFIPQVIELENVYLDGYWQSEKYFKDNKDAIKNDFQFKNTLDAHNQEIVNKMNQTNSVSIHVRRGDYISDSQAAKVHGGITTLAYYKKAIDMINDKVDNPVFFIFSDDIAWVRENINLKNSYFIDWNQGKDSYKDLQLMSNCKHNIIANSSFSWWGAWLNKNDSKIVVSPNKWFNTKNAEDVISDDWVKINVDELQ